MKQVRKHIIITLIATALAVIYLLQRPGGAFYIISPLPSAEEQGPPGCPALTSCDTEPLRRQHP